MSVNVIKSYVQFTDSFPFACRNNETVRHSLRGPQEGNLAALWIWYCISVISSNGILLLPCTHEDVINWYNSYLNSIFAEKALYRNIWDNLDHCILTFTVKIYWVFGQKFGIRHYDSPFILGFYVSMKPFQISNLKFDFKNQKSALFPSPH